MRRIILTIFLCLLCSVSSAQISAISTDNFYVIDDFSGLLKSHVSAYLMPKNSAVQALNVRGNEKYGTLAKRSKMLLLGSDASDPIKSLFRHYISDDTKHTIATYSTNVAIVDDSGTNTLLYASGSDAKRWSFVTYKDFLIGMNGTDNSKKWDGETTTTADTDGSRTAGDLLTDLGAPFAELNTGTNLDASSWYQYKISYYDGTNYTYSNARSNPILTGATVYNIYLTDVPLGPDGTTHRYIYRTLGGADRATVVADTTFYLVGTLSDNSTRVFADTVTDNTADDDSAPTWSTSSGGTNVSPPKGKLALINTERLFIANDPSAEFQALGGQSTIYWSEALNPDYFNYNVDYELIRPDDGDDITFIKNVLGVLTIGKTRSINKFYTTASSSSSWTVSDPFSTDGCVAMYSAVETPLGIIYLGRYSIHRFNGQNSSVISDVVTDKVRDILATNVGEVAGIYHDNRYLMSYTSESSGASNNDRVLILDTVRNSYYMDTKSIDSFANFDSGTDFGTLYSGSSEDDGNIYAHGGAFSRLVYRYKSQLEGGTVDSIRVTGSEDDPEIILGNDDKWSESTDTWADSGLKTWMIDSLTGYWSSEVILVNATEYDKIYWNERLKSTGDVTFAIRSAANTPDTLTATYSSEFSDPSGSDISGETANTYVQIRGTLTSGLYTETPKVFLEDAFVIRMTYKKEGTTGETAINAVWQSGKTDLGAGNLPTRIKELQIYYEGTEGTLNFKFQNMQGDSYDFDIDLSVDPTTDENDTYFGTNSNKIYVHIPSNQNIPNGRHWDFTVTENGTETWTIDRIAIRLDVNSYTTFK
ncbi:MAG: hypothetical protein U9O94_01365 [Nanoarchaeota archaeon]|nr:hypothetical protein [Nanoarchaeota archaeon]